MSDMRDKIKVRILPKVQMALESGSYDFIAKNAIRIYDLKTSLEPDIAPKWIEITWEKELSDGE